MNPQDNGPQSDNQIISAARALEVLQKGEIAVEHGLLRWSSNYAFLVTIAHEDIEVTTVYKPQRGERPLWDFPDGTLCYREMASFLTSEELGWQIVPPTVLREGSRGLGTFQLFIDHDPDVNYFTFDETQQPQLMRMAALDAIINNADRKGGHCILDGQGHLWGIDHGITFNTAHKLRTVIWDFAGQAIPANILEDIGRLCANLNDTNTSYRKQVQELLTNSEIAAFQRRIDRLMSASRYPLPGSGPNYPWPPV
ncbi:MAG: SCO1664 family protein [Anaerolineae bacterium]|nr:SCO1664 family protein [Anaerolineae bacterium]